MKNIAMVILATSLIACTFYGCKSQKIQVIENKEVVTNSVPLQAFNDESYVWESWSFGTNEVKNVGK